jgi:anti-sigma-K factor RskA
MIDDDDIDGLAAEYVLGSLSSSERSAVDARRQVDPALSEAIAAWERRLGPLNDRVPDVEPPAHLFGQIIARIAAQGAQPVRSAEIITLRRSAGRWRRVAITATALAACLVLAVGWLLYHEANSPQFLAAELYRAQGGPTADEITHPAFVVSVDVGACRVSIRPVTAQPRQGRSYELWVMRPGAGTPSSLGVIAQSRATTLPCPTGFPAGELVNAMLAVSLESEGGSTAGTPSGSFIFVGKLAPTQGGATR